MSKVEVAICRVSLLLGIVSKETIFIPSQIAMHMFRLIFYTYSYESTDIGNMLSFFLHIFF